MISGESMRGTNDKEARMVKATASDLNKTKVWSSDRKESRHNASRRFLAYRVVPLPWPLSPRDIFYHGSYVFDEEESVVVGYTGSFSHPAIAPARKGYVRAEVKFQGYCTESLGADTPGCRLHWL